MLRRRNGERVESKLNLFEEKKRLPISSNLKENLSLPRNITRYEREKRLFVEIKSGRERGKKWNYTGKSKPAFLSPPSNSRDIQKGSFVKPETTLRRMDPFCKLAGQNRAGQI